MNHDLQGSVASDLHPTLSQLLSFFKTERLALAGAASDEHGGDVVSEQVLRLRLHLVKLERAIRLKGRVGGGDQSL
jgi:hypothetical protein